MPRSTSPQSRTPRVYVLLTVFLVVAALYFARDVMIPLALAMLLSFLFTPVVNRAERLRVGRPAAVMGVVCLAFILIGILAYVVVDQVTFLASNLDQYKGNIITKVQKIRPSGGGAFGKLVETAKEIQQKVDEPATQSTNADGDGATRPAGASATDVAAAEVAARTRTARVADRESVLRGRTPNPATSPSRENPVPVSIVEPSPSPLQTLGQYLGLALGPLGTFGIVIVFVIFMLLQREDLRNRLIRLVGHGQLTVTTQALDDASKRISRYLLAQAIVNGTYGAAVAIGLWLIGWYFGNGTDFPGVILWGLLCALLRFIPYIGPWIGATFPLTVAFAVYPGFGVFVASGALFIGIELLSNNIMEPLMYGASTGMSTLAILVSAVFWTWLWGPIGLLLSTPLTVVLVVLGKYVPQLQFLDVMLGDEPVLTPPERMYQRLLALDPEEATELAREYWQSGSLESLYDTVLMPALGMAEQDRHAGQLDDRRDKFVRQTIRDIIDELGDEERERARSAKPGIADASGNGKAMIGDEDSTLVRRAKLPDDANVNVVCLPAHDPADEICNMMLAQLLELRGYRAVSISQNALASEMLDEVARNEADVVVVGALPPSAVAHARYLCKRLSVRLPQANVIVGIWLSRAEPKTIRDRIRCVTNVGIAKTLEEMLREINQRATSLIPRAKSKSA